MAMTDKTINAAGGGDFTTAQAWCDTRKTSGNDERGLIQGNTSVGPLNEIAYSDDARNYVLQAADGNENQGVWNQGAQVGQIQFYVDRCLSISLYGLQINGILAFTPAHSTTFNMERCIMEVTDSIPTSINAGNVDGVTIRLNFRNNVFKLVSIASPCVYMNMAAVL